MEKIIILQCTAAVAMVVVDIQHKGKLKIFTQNN